LATAIVVLAARAAKTLPRLSSRATAIGGNSMVATESGE
jgi:hypothetical protein